MSSMSRKLLYVGLGLLLLMVLLVFFTAWAFKESEFVKDRVEQEASEALGMQVRVEGPARLLFLPSPGLRIEDFNIRNGDAEWIQASSMEVRLRTIPLLRGHIEVTEVELIQANLQLERDVQGKLNFMPEPDEEPTEPEPFDLQRFESREANLVFIDHESGERVEAQGCDWTMVEFDWQPAAPDSPGINLPSFQGEMACARLDFAGHTVNELHFQVFAQDGQAVFEELTGEVLGGRFQGRLESDLAEDVPAHFLELELADFQILRFLETIHEEPQAEGSLDFIARLTFTGTELSEMVAGMNGHAELSGRDLVFYGLDMDEMLDDYEDTQKFDLIDAGALFVAGPFGLVVSKAYDFGSIFIDTGAQTHIRVLYSEWEIIEGIAWSIDVALSTQKNRLAMIGGLNFVNSRFEDMKVAVVDIEGCAIVEQSIEGDFDDPEIADPEFLAELVGPLTDVVERIIELFNDVECDPFYTGRVQHPQSE